MLFIFIWIIAGGWIGFIGPRMFLRIFRVDIGGWYNYANAALGALVTYTIMV